jgi:hypothetical protein
MAQVNIPKKQSSMDKASGFLPLAGAIGAGLLAIPTGGASLAAMPAILGAAGTGAALGGAAKGGLDMLGATNQPGMSAVERRMGGKTEMPTLPDQQTALNNARIELQSQPPEVQQQYMPMLTAAALKLNRSNGVA